MSVVLLPSPARAGSFYGGFALGTAVTDIDRSYEQRTLDQALASIGMTGTIDGVERRDSLFKGFVGYRLNRHLAVELGAHDLGRIAEYFTVTSGGSGSGRLQFSTIGVTASVLGILPLGDRIDVFGRLGGHGWQVTSTLVATGPGGTASVSEKAQGVGSIAGAGVHLRLAEPLGLRVEWERVYNVGDPEKTGQGAFNLSSAGLQFRFR